MNSRKAFTLIELLVVIAIIALLVSILMPSLKKAKDLAKAAACTASLRNVHVSFLAYAGDFNGIVPNEGLAPLDGAATAPANMFTAWMCYVMPRTTPLKTIDGVLQHAGYGDPVPWVPTQSWGDNLNIYCAAWGISNQWDGPYGNNVDAGHFGINYKPVYGLNGSLPPWARAYSYTARNGGTYPYTARYMDIMAVPYASDTYFMGDSNIGYLAKCWGETTPFGTALRHMGDLNISYLDGHVLKTRYDKLTYMDGGPPASNAYERRPWFALPGKTTIP